MSHDQPKEMHYLFKEIYGNFECIPQVGMKIKDLYIWVATTQYCLIPPKYG